jgi:toxin FitB
VTGYLIDTNVISELRRGRRANPGVLGWIDATPGESMFVSVLTAGELKKGIERIRSRDPRAAESLGLWLETLLDSFADRLLPVDLDVALDWGAASTTPRPVIDGLISATARRHGLTVVTRNVRDFDPDSLDVLDPFTP